MTCAWECFLQILPGWIKTDVDKFGRNRLQELRLRRDAEPELVLGAQIRYLSGKVSESDLVYCIQMASRYSPWAAETVNQGYVTAPGGHRLGICGTAVYKNGIFSGVREVSSLCIRVARDVEGIAAGVQSSGCVLILGAPGWGKTTLLRDYIRCRAQRECVAVVDERGELFPKGFQQGKRMDILTGCEKPEGITMALCTMGPEYIAVDEITQERDCQALLQASRCGVRLLATAHASDREDLVKRPVYRQLAELNVFHTLVVLDQKKTWRMEKWEVAL